MSDNTTSNCDDIILDVANPPPSYSRGVCIFITIVLLCLLFICIAGNLFLVVSIATWRKLQNRTGFFVFSLAVADIGVAVFAMPFAIYQQYTNKKWYLGKTFCLVATSLDVMFCTVSILHLLCLCIDRYLAVCHPFVYLKLSKAKEAAMLAFCWVVPIFISFVPIMNKWHTIGIEDLIACLADDDEVCVYIVNREFAFIGSFVAFYIPITFMVIGYWKTHQRIAGRKLFMKQATRFQTRENKTTKTLFIIMGCFSLCWFPFFILNLADPLLGYKIPYEAWTVALWMGYLNSLINPFLYYKFNSNFKFGYILLLHRTFLGRFDDRLWGRRVSLLVMSSVSFFLRSSSEKKNSAPDIIDLEPNKTDIDVNRTDFDNNRTDFETYKTETDK